MELETKNHMLMPYLPHELIIQILLRLPVKSLIRFKCVCKSWFSIISDSHFANSQFELTVATHTHRVLFIATVSPHETLSIDLEASLDDDSSIVSLNPNFIPSEPSPYIEIKGSCRGFILFLYRRSSFYLWNPSTGVHKNIPLSPLSFILEGEADYFYGFGYDRSTDDYLVVSMSSHTHSSYLEFFSLRANTWKQIDYEGTDFHYLNATEEYDPKVGFLFNGAIHWLVFSLDLKKDAILAFDLMEWTLLDMPLPDEVDYELDSSGLWVFQEFLSIWSRNYDNDTVEIWVMKEYKLHSSWTKTHVLSTDAIPTKNFSPLRSTKSGDIVGADDHTGLVKYNDERQLLGHHSYSNNPHEFQVAVYTESLLSLAGDNVQA
ncbi:F-box/kelch-repeat protein [Trifolium repens]|nr:F-box/kelch-repeat protein [Trifolium repens]